jgi:hypothetical protein
MRATTRPVRPPVAALLIGAALALSLPALAAPSLPLAVLRTLGADEEEILLYRPEDIAFGPAGKVYVLNAGDCHVLEFDRDWNHVRSFAKQGQGPGEFETATGFLVHAGLVWIFETGRATRFSLEGEYVDTLPLQRLVQAPVVRGDEILARLDASDRAACRLDGDLELIAKIGPTCVTDDWMRRYQECGFVHVLTHPDWLCLLVNPFDGKLHAVAESGEVARTVALVEEAGRSSAEEPEEGTVSMSFTLVMGRCCVDRDGLLWTLPLSLDEEGDDRSPQRIVVRDRSFDVLAECVLPGDVRGYQLVQAPDGNLILLDAAESRLYVLAYPELPRP